MRKHIFFAGLVLTSLAFLLISQSVKPLVAAGIVLCVHAFTCWFFVFTPKTA